MSKEPMSLELQAALNHIDALEERVAGLIAYLAVQANQQKWQPVHPDDPSVDHITSRLTDTKLSSGGSTDKFAELTIEIINKHSRP